MPGTRTVEEHDHTDTPTPEEHRRPVDCLGHDATPRTIRAALAEESILGRWDSYLGTHCTARITFFPAEELCQSPEALKQVNAGKVQCRHGRFLLYACAFLEEEGSEEAEAEAEVEAPAPEEEAGAEGPHDAGEEPEAASGEEAVAATEGANS